jgi:4'-phosphopantetheinyl transferase
MDVHWLSRSWQQVPDTFEWLHPSEKEVLGQFKFDKRKNDWLLGRWTAKNAVISYFKDVKNELSFHNLEIIKASDGAPEVFYEGEPFPCIISLSHSNEMGFCTIARPQIKIGCDLEKIESRSQSFLNDYFTEKELSNITAYGKENIPLLGNLLWSAKESVMKALRVGLSIDTRQVQIECLPSNESGIWKTFDIYLPNYDVKLYGKWQLYQGFVYTIVCDHKGFELLEIK